MLKLILELRKRGDCSRYLELGEHDAEVDYWSQEGRNYERL